MLVDEFLLGPHRCRRVGLARPVRRIAGQEKASGTEVHAEDNRIEVIVGTTGRWLERRIDVEDCEMGTTVQCPLLPGRERRPRDTRRHGYAGMVEGDASAGRDRCR